MFSFNLDVHKKAGTLDESSTEMQRADTLQSPAAVMQSLTLDVLMFRVCGWVSPTESGP